MFNPFVEKINYATSGQSIYIYAGPDKESVSVEMQKPLKKEVKIIVVNGLGQTISSSLMPAGKLNQQVKFLSAARGIYYVRLDNDDIHYVKKIIIQ